MAPRFCKLSLSDKVIEATWERHAVERYTLIGDAVGIVPWNGPVILAFDEDCTGVTDRQSLDNEVIAISVVQYSQNGGGIDKVSFTSSCATGQEGHTELQLALKIALSRSSHFCMAIERVYVHESVYDAELAGIIKFSKSLKVGNGLEVGIDIGPFSNCLRCGQETLPGPSASR
ncbi:hypothetical protein F5Y19DRAFT_469676 [Xylariaceae sp. FL1651]|nr:hypothetical protein F5Y19DRAFT_469676 [Xylariaceae sp. FL1651]